MSFKHGRVKLVAQWNPGEFEAQTLGEYCGTKMLMGVKPGRTKVVSENMQGRGCSDGMI